MLIFYYYDGHNKKINGENWWRHENQIKRGFQNDQDEETLIPPIIPTVANNGNSIATPAIGQQIPNTAPGNFASESKIRF